MVDAFIKAVRRMIEKPELGVLSDFNTNLDALPQSQARAFDLDVLTAFALLDPSDSANPWNAASRYSEQELYEASAVWYVEASAALSRDVETGNLLTGDESDWARAAKFNAVRALTSAGLLLSASVLLHQLDSTNREEARRQISDALVAAGNVEQLVDDQPEDQ